MRGVRIGGSSLFPISESLSGGFNEVAYKLSIMAIETGSGKAGWQASKQARASNSQPLHNESEFFMQENHRSSASA